MKGSIRKRGNTYQFRISYNVNKKRKQIERGGFKTKKECEVAMNKAINEVNDTGRYLDLAKIDMDYLFNEFIEKDAKLTRKESSIRRYKSLYRNHIQKAFANKYIYMITPTQIQEFYIHISTTISTTYAKSMHNLLRLLFKYAFRMDYIKYNVMDKVKPPKLDKPKDIVTFTHDQLSWILKRAESTSVKTAIMLGLHLGLRAGEVYALRWSDFNFENNTVKIDKQLQRVNNSLSFTTLKTKSSYRTLNFGNVLKNYLLETKKYQDMMLKHKKIVAINRIVDTIHDNKVIIVDDFVNIKNDGSMLSNISHKRFSEACRKEGNIDFKFHYLRHTHATLLIEQGLNPKYVQERLGHSKIDMTLRIYTHVTNNMNDQALDILDNNLSF